MLKQINKELSDLKAKIDKKSNTGGVTSEDIFQIIDIQGKLITELEKNLLRLGMIERRLP